MKKLVRIYTFRSASTIANSMLDTYLSSRNFSAHLIFAHFAARKFDVSEIFPFRRCVEFRLREIANTEKTRVSACISTFSIFYGIVHLVFNVS